MACTRPLNLAGLVEEGVATADGPLHLVRVNIMAVAHHNGAALGNEVRRNPVLRKLLRDEDRVGVPQHWVDLVDVLTILDILLDSLEVTSDASAPPCVLRALALQILAYRVLVGEAVALVASIIDGAQTCSRQWPIKVRIKVLHEHLDQVPIAHGARDHQRRHLVVVQWRVWIHARLQALAHGEDITVYNCVLKLVQVLRQGVPEVIVREALRILAFLLRRVLKCPRRKHGGNRSWA
mmetsp:Transcript_90660/g.252150  ORF Transcript_90660/g.252150 Transcript_90660/m.252150 type:complete len:237 (+) Transcript_90660:180-890(+)